VTDTAASTAANTATDAAAAVARYLAAWNETDAAARGKAMAAAFTDDVTYVDPLMEVSGRDALDAAIAAVQAQFAGLVFRLGDGQGSGHDVDAHHALARFSWELGPSGGEALAVGFDVAEFAADGRIRSVRGFLDRIPDGI
jgi:ketosteroid isomerase-like protein